MRACALDERGRPSSAPVDVARDLLLRETCVYLFSAFRCTANTRASGPARSRAPPRDRGSGGRAREAQSFPRLGSGVSEPRERASVVRPGPEARFVNSISTHIPEARSQGPICKLDISTHSRGPICKLDINTHSRGSVSRLDINTILRSAGARVVVLSARGAVVVKLTNRL